MVRVACALHMLGCQVPRLVSLEGVYVSQMAPDGWILHFRLQNMEHFWKREAVRPPQGLVLEERWRLPDRVRPTMRFDSMLSRRVWRSFAKSEADVNFYCQNH